MLHQRQRNVVSTAEICHNSTGTVNPLMLIAAKSSLPILVKPFKLKHKSQNICRRNVDQNINNTFPSNIF